MDDPYCYWYDEDDNFCMQKLQPTGRVINVCHDRVSIEYAFTSDTEIKSPLHRVDLSGRERRIF